MQCAFEIPNIICHSVFVLYFHVLSARLSVFTLRLNRINFSIFCWASSLFV